MADFQQSNDTKTAVRKLAEPLANVTAFDTIVQGVITNNPFQCTQYNQGGADHPGVERNRQTYTARIIYQDVDAKTVGIVTVRASTIAAFTSVANRVLADTEIATALGGSPVRDSPNERYTTTLKCHDANGEIYYLSFSRDQVTLSSYSDETIRAKVETWADTVATLA